MFGILKRKRARLRDEPFPTEWREIIRKNISLFPRLSAADQDELLGHVQIFLAEKRFEGCDDLQITDEIRVTIAAQACLLLLHRKPGYFPRLLTILVYPSTYVAPERTPLTENIWNEGRSTRLGETSRHMGSMVLAWDAAKDGAADPSDGRNVVLHEFAHQLDYEDYIADGVPGLTNRQQHLSWRAVMRLEFAALRAADATGIPTLLDTYGATSPAEFFAVAVEAFFERPRALRSRHPKMYAELRQFFQQDPVEYSAEH